MAQSSIQVQMCRKYFRQVRKIFSVVMQVQTVGRGGKTRSQTGGAPAYYSPSLLIDMGVMLRIRGRCGDWITRKPISSTWLLMDKPTGLEKLSAEYGHLCP